MAEPDRRWPDWTGGWRPSVETVTTAVAPAPVAGFAAMLDAGTHLADPGTPLPALWHWIALAAWPAGSAVGADGHPPPGGFMPPVPYPRRMWLGVVVDIAAPPAVGAEVVVSRTVSDVVAKTGKSGPFAVVTVTTDVTSSTGEPLLREQAQFGYRSAADRPPAATPHPAAHGAGRPWLSRVGQGWRFAPDPVMLMRFSALTANSHRIHYDVPYATAVEGYPDLLVHGPLMATMIAEAVRRDQPAGRVARFECRALRPFFLGGAATIHATTAGAALHLELRDDTGEAAGATGAAYMTAEVSLR